MRGQDNIRCATELNLLVWKGRRHWQPHGDTWLFLSCQTGCDCCLLPQHAIL